MGMGWDVLHIHRVYFTYPSGEELMENVWKVTFKTIQTDFLTTGGASCY